jgi:hypothetical protein
MLCRDSEEPACRGAKLKRSANMASVAGAAKIQTYRFRPPFLWFFLWTNKESKNKKAAPFPGQLTI